MDTKDIIIADRASSKAQHLTIFKQEKYVSKSFGAQKAFDGVYTDNLLFFEDDLEFNNMLVLPNFSEQILSINLSETHL